MLTCKKQFLLLILCFFGYHAIAQQGNASESKVEPLKFNAGQMKGSQREVQNSRATKAIAPSADTKEELDESDSRILSGSNVQSLNKYNELRNSFLINDGAVSKQENNELNKLVQESFIQTNGSFESRYLLLRQNRNSSEAYKYLRQANQVSPNNPLLYLERAWQAERIRNVELRNQALKQAYNSNQISKLLIEINKWIINYASSNALIITNGEHDTYPLWYNQPQKNIQVLSLSFLNDIDYLRQILKAWDPSIEFNDNANRQDILNVILSSKQASYFTWSVHPDVLKENKQNLYPVGAMLEFSNTKVDNIRQLKNFYLDKNVGNYIIKGNWSKDSFAPVMKNLIHGINIILDSKSYSKDEKIKLIKLKKAITSRLTTKSNAGGR
jgi:hypothetical protein